MAENTVQQLVVRHLNSQHSAIVCLWQHTYQLQTMFMHMIDPNSRLLLWKVLKAHVAPMFRNHQDLLQIFQQKKKIPSKLLGYQWTSCKHINLLACMRSGHPIPPNIWGILVQKLTRIIWIKIQIIWTCSLRREDF